MHWIRRLCSPQGDVKKKSSINVLFIPRSPFCSTYPHSFAPSVKGKELVPNAKPTESVKPVVQSVVQIARFDPLTNSQKIESYTFEKSNDFMVLDLLVAIKAHQDPSLAFRASCCEGVCGSCAMNINGINSLACVTFAKNHTTVAPLPNMPIIKDLVVDFKLFFNQYAYIQPYIRNVNLHNCHIQEIYKRYKKTLMIQQDSFCLSVEPKRDLQLSNVPDKTLAYIRILDQLTALKDTSKLVYILLKMRREGFNLSRSLEGRFLRVCVTTMPRTLKSIALLEGNTMQNNHATKKPDE